MAPLGLSALDMLRIESGLIFANYEFDDQVDPFEAGIGFAVVLDSEDDFVGKQALIERSEHPQRKLVGLELEGEEPGHGDCVHVPGERASVGVVTSGTRSPILRKNIALCRMAIQHAEPGTAIEVGKLDGEQKRIPRRSCRFRSSTRRGAPPPPAARDGRRGPSRPAHIRKPFLKSNCEALSRAPASPLRLPALCRPSRRRAEASVLAAVEEERLGAVVDQAYSTRPRKSEWSPPQYDFSTLATGRAAVHDGCLVDHVEARLGCPVAGPAREAVRERAGRSPER